MRRFAVGLLLLACACQSRPTRDDHAAGQTDADLAHPATRPLVVTEATVVAFWLPASDTLKPGDGADLLDDFRAYTTLVAPDLDAQGIRFAATTADSIVVNLDGGPRRVIMLSGLDFPFGYVLVEPGFPETILTGVSTNDELMDEVNWYFGLDQDNDSGGRDRRT